VKSVLNNAVPVKPVMEPASQSVPTVFLVTSAISALLLIGLITLSVLQFIKIFGSAAQ